MAGPRLNIKKTKGIWLGPLKDLGLRKYCNVTWTGKPIKCLGIYLGHDHDKCNVLNWNKKMDAVRKILSRWKQRSSSLTLQGKILVIKMLAMSKMFFPASLLCIPEYIRKELKQCIFEFIWGKRDRIKRLHLISSIENGGLNMIDIDSFLMSLKAAWVTKFINMEGDWKNVLLFHLKRLSLPMEYILKMNFKSLNHFPVLAKIPTFYQEIFIAFNKIKQIIPIHLTNSSELMEQPLFGNELFMNDHMCLYMKHWIQSNILYVKDLVDENGIIICDNQLYGLIKQKHSILQDMYIIKNTIVKYLKNLDLQTAINVNIGKDIKVIVNNKRYIIKDQKSNFFYSIVKNKVALRSDMEAVWSKQFGFKNTASLWNSVYTQKLKVFNDNKLAEFNFKVLHNIIPTGYNLSKWNTNISERCTICNEIESMHHMLYECTRVKSMWNLVSHALNVEIKWKHLVCGYILYDLSDKVNLLNLLYTVIMYAIFKHNSNSKFENTSYKDIHINKIVKKNVCYYRNVLLCQKTLTENHWQDEMFKKIENIL